MKTRAFYLMTIILLLSWCSGCSHSVPAQSEIVAKTVNPTETNTNDLEPKTNPQEDTVLKAYRSILSGNFTLIDEDDYKKEIEVDGYSFHGPNTIQSQRDNMKDEILHKYRIPIVRFKTNESSERKRLEEVLAGIVG